LFLYRHILKKDFGEHKDIPRAKQSRYIPVVLSRREIDAVMKHLEHPYGLVVKLLYGCGLRLFECVKLRMHNFNFDEGILTVQDGKGKKARTAPLPQSINAELLRQLEIVRKLHDEDLSVNNFLWQQYRQMGNVLFSEKLPEGSGCSLKSTPCHAEGRAYFAQHERSWFG
jgi:integrase